MFFGLDLVLLVLDLIFLFRGLQIYYCLTQIWEFVFVCYPSVVPSTVVGTVPSLTDVVALAFKHRISEKTLQMLIQFDVSQILLADAPDVMFNWFLFLFCPISMFFCIILVFVFFCCDQTRNMYRCHGCNLGLILLINK